MRKLAAVDLSGLGPRIIIPEFALGVIGPMALGVWTLMRSTSLGGALFGSYLLALSLNYLPLLVYAIQITRQRSIPATLADEPSDRGALFRKYRRVSLLLMVPAVVPLIALTEWWQARSNRSRVEITAQCQDRGHRRQHDHEDDHNQESV